MADNENVTIRIRVRADTKELARVQAQLAALCKQADDCHDTFSNLGRRFDDNDKSTRRASKGFNKTSKDLNVLSKVGKSAAKVIGKTFKIAMIGAAIETAAFAVALSSVNLLLKTGQVLARAWNATVRGVGVASANAAAGVLTLVSAFMAAQRQFVAAQATGRYGGSFKNASNSLRALQSDSQLAVFGLESLTGAFNAASKNARVTGQTVAGLRGLADFAVTSGDMEKGLVAAAELISLLQSGKEAGGESVLKAAGQLGPEFEKAYKNIIEGGKKTNDELIKIIASGELADAAGVSGAAGAVRGSLMGQIKAFATEAQVMFADIGGYMLEPIQEAFEQITFIFKRMMLSITGNLVGFARGPFIDAAVSATEKIANFMAKLFNEYLPKTEEVLSNFINGWRRFSSKVTSGFEKFNKFLNKFSNASKSINKFFGTIFRAIGQGISNNFNSFATMVVEREDDLMAFGKALGDLIGDIFKLLGEIRNAFFDALPTINKFLDAIGFLIEGFAQLLALISGIPGFGGSVASTAALVGLAAVGTKTGRKGLKKGAQAGGGKGGAAMSATALALLGLSATQSASYNTAKAAGGNVASTGTGIAVGATTMAAAGSMFGPYGTIAGLIIGGIWGGIQGYLAGNKVQEQTKKAGEAFADGFAAGVDELIATGHISDASDLLLEFNQQALELATNFSNEDQFANGALAKFNENLIDLRGRLGLASRRSRDLAKISGMTTSEIEELAQAMEIDLGNPLLNLKDIMYDMGIAVYKFGDDFNAAMNQVFGDSLSIIQNEKDKLTSEAAVDQSLRAMIEGGFGEAQVLDFIESALFASAAYSEGDPLKDYDQIRQMLVEGKAFSEPGTRGYGYLDEFTAAGGMELVNRVMAQRSQALIDQTVANAVAQAADIGVAVDPAQLSSRLSALEQTDNAQFLQAIDALRNETFLSDMYRSDLASGPALGTLTANRAFESIGLGGILTEVLESAPEQIDILTNIDTKTETTNTKLDEVKNAINNLKTELVNALGKDSGGFFGNLWKGFNSFANWGGSAVESGWNSITGTIGDVFGSIFGDSASPRSRLLDSMYAHGSISGGIAGKRTVTSGLRNYQLGSLSSDHLTGRALDITGQNLGQYKQAIEAAGGFADFHGAGGSRHLHVVPNTNAVGDTAVPYMSGGGGTGTMVSSNDSYSIVINAAPGMDAKLIADEVMNRIQRSQRNAAERY